MVTRAAARTTPVKATQPKPATDESPEVKAPEAPQPVGAIYGSLAAVMAEVDHVAKRDFNQHARYNFRGIDAVVNAVGPVLRRHHVLVVPDVEDVTYAPVTTSNNKPSTACRVTVAYWFYAPDGSSLAARVIGEAWDTGDKAAPKAMSVAFRTALLQALALPTDDPDPDSYTYEQHTRTREEWDTVLATATSVTNIDTLRAMWTQERIGSAPDDVQADFRAHVSAVTQQNGDGGA